MAMRVPILPPDLQRQLDGELRPGEKLLWAEQPLPGAFTRQSLGKVIFGIPFTAFAVFWMYAAAGGLDHSSHRAHGPPVFFSLFGIPFLLIGLGMLTSPIWTRRKTLRTLYAVTDQRAIILEISIAGAVKSQTFMPAHLTSMTRIERADGSGDLVFEQVLQAAGKGSVTIRRGFIGISQVRQVEDLIMNTLLPDHARPA
jgi:hypothetical protein